LDETKVWADYLDAAVAADEERSGSTLDQFAVSGRGKETYEYWRDELGPELATKYIRWWGDSGDSYHIATDLPPDRAGNTVGVEYGVECMIGGTEYLGYIDRVFVDATGALILAHL